LRQIAASFSRTPPLLPPFFITPLFSPFHFYARKRQRAAKESSDDAAAAQRDAMARATAARSALPRALRMPRQFDTRVPRCHYYAIIAADIIACHYFRYLYYY
jgi:hypothetical protein